jgi:hypothetical protein
LPGLNGGQLKSSYQKSFLHFVFRHVIFKLL